jgi:hypothetical protein
MVEETVQHDHHADHAVVFAKDDKEVGHLDWDDGLIVAFHGNADASAKVFFEHLQRYFASHKEGMKTLAERIGVLSVNQREVIEAKITEFEKEQRPHE